jgi:hypothetical protein
MPTLDRERLVRGLVVDVAVLCFFGYLVAQVIDVLYWVFSTQPVSFVTDSLTGGAFVAFVLVPIPYLAIGYAAAVRREKEALRLAAEEERPSSDEEVPGQPQPEAEQQVPPYPPPGEEPDDATEPRVVVHRAAQLPQHEGAEDHAPPGLPHHTRQHLRRGYPFLERTKRPPVRLFGRRDERADLWRRTLAGEAKLRTRDVVGIAGWVAIIAGGIAFETWSLGHEHVETLSQVVRFLMRPDLGRGLLLVGWIVVGFALFGPE